MLIGTLFECVIRSLKIKTNLLNLCLLIGDPGYDRTAQTEQRNIQQGLQQLLLQGGRPHPGLTGQSLN